MLTELIFEGVLNDLSAEEVVALLSALVFEVRGAVVHSHAARACTRA
jgi:superfamily II RNA helicase